MKRWIAAFLLLCMLAGLLSACSPSGGDERTEPLTKDVSPQSYTETKDGVTLRVTVQNPVCRPGDTVEVEAVVTNASDETIEYWLPMSTPKLHLEIRAKIGNDAFEFPDIDGYGKPGDTAIGHGSLAPGASYTQKMRFYAGSAKEGTDGGWEKAKKTPASSGRYAGTAVFRWDNQENLKDGKSVAVAFPITVQAD